MTCYTSGDDMQQNHDSSLLLPCLARQILTDYPGETKQKFYALWLKKHDQASLDNLRRLVSLEYRNFCGWCALHGYVPAFPMFKTYSECNPVRVLTEDTIISGEPAPRPPWWSEIPNARPAGVAL